MRYSIPIIIVSLLFVGCSDTEGVKKMREPAVAGAFYPGEKGRLSKTIDEFLKEVPKETIPGRLIALISPHAGYAYSGKIATYGYKLLEGLSFTTVVLVGPSHHVYFPGISVYKEGYYKTPLGEIEIDTKLAEAIMEENESIRFYEKAHLQEHSIEVQLPFLQKVLKEFKIVPIIMGDAGEKYCDILSFALSKHIKDKNILLIASTDLSHYHSYEKAVALDSIARDKVKSLDDKGLIKDLQAGKCELCGGGPTIAVIKAAKELGADACKILKYANSGDVTGDKSRVVGYLSAGIYKKNPPESNEDLSEEEGHLLLDIARKTIEGYVKSKKIPEFEIPPGKLHEKRGAFVTLRKRGTLRGCIGRFDPTEPLYQVVIDMSIASATQDVRFLPVREEELEDIDIEISVLSPLKRAKDAQEIEMGKHGVYIKRGIRSGCYLPQVATETGWDRQTFLENLCATKANLPKDAWRDKETEIYIFTCQIFEEKQASYK
ncbi:MAG: AmmeMemoRadiSam system protein B [bacterium]|nr:AmmeMemoRadiSam system protein B [bacterium]